MAIRSREYNEEWRSRRRATGKLGGDVGGLIGRVAMSVIDWGVVAPWTRCSCLLWRSMNWRTIV